MNEDIVGRRGLGKSTLALYRAYKLNDNVIVFDTNNQFRNAECRTSSIKEVREKLKDAAGSDNKKTLYLAYIPQGDVELEWDSFAETIWPFGDYSLIIDEAHRLQKPQYVNQRLDRLLRQAPRRERGDDNPIDIIQCFHRPVDINGIVLALTDYVYIFKLTKSRDLEYIEKEFDSEVAYEVGKLKTPPEGREVLRVNVETNEFLLLTKPQEWYNPIRKASTSKRSVFDFAI